MTRGWDGRVVNELQSHPAAFWMEPKTASVCSFFMPQLGIEAVAMANLYERVLHNSARLEEPCEQDLTYVTRAIEITVSPTFT